MENVAATTVASGPRLAGRLTPELVLRSPQYMNCVQKYEIDLRGNKISVIENLGATEDQFDSMDLSDNAITFLEGFPKLNRLKVLLLNNNRISRIGRNLQELLPKLEMLILTNNKIEQLHALDPLGTLTQLNHLSLLGNPVTKQQNYRQYVVQLLPNLTVLDFTKVKAKEREIVDESHLFDPDKDVEMAEPGEKQKASAKKKGPDPEKLTAIKAAIQNAETLEEVRQLEAALKSGVMPSELREEGHASTDVMESESAEEKADGDKDEEMNDTT